MLKLTRNAIRCKKCGDVLDSKSRNDFVSCSCGQCFNDGGLSYMRRGFRTERPEDSYEDLSEYEEVPDEFDLDDDFPAPKVFSSLIDPKD